MIEIVPCREWKEWEKLIGKRMLVDRRGVHWLRSPVEVILLEVSPSGKYLKFIFPNGVSSWSIRGEYLFVEVLP